MTQVNNHRPQRPTQEFLARVGIQELPDNVDLTFQDGGGTTGVSLALPRAFVIAVHDNNGGVSEQTVDAFEKPDLRTVDDIYADLNRTLLNLGATPARG